jgi:hypothetical protein
VIVGVPDQDPVAAVSVSPSRSVPDTAGSAVFVGGAAPITPVAADVVVAEPAAFVAVTCARTVAPTSADTRTYVALVAPAMSAHDAPPESQRRHW